MSLGLRSLLQQLTDGDRLRHKRAISQLDKRNSSGRVLGIGFWAAVVEPRQVDHLQDCVQVDALLRLSEAAHGQSWHAGVLAIVSSQYMVHSRRTYQPLVDWARLSRGRR
eukprot:COSAG06_NODE_643_length_13477_cov_19.795410_4_plen_110_part_00